MLYVFTFHTCVFHVSHFTFFFVFHVLFYASFTLFMLHTSRILALLFYISLILFCSAFIDFLLLESGLVQSLGFIHYGISNLKLTPYISRLACDTSEYVCFVCGLKLSCIFRV